MNSPDDKYIWMVRPDLRDLPEPVVPDGYKIRTYRTGDAADWTKIQREVRKDMDVKDGTFDDEYPGGEDIRSKRIFFAVDASGQPGGSVGAWYGKEGPEGKHGSLHWMAVLPAHSGRGVGYALLLSALRTMAKMHDDAYLATGTFLLPAIQMYLKAGFTPGIASKYDRLGWETVSKTISHPALENALKSRWYEPPAENPAPDEVISWLRNNAIPLSHCQAGHGFADMQPLREIVGNARIVSLGEATHGTREFFQLKHRMVEFLVEEMGFTAFAIEANLPEAFMLDRYVTTGEGDPADGLTNLRFWTWNTKEVLALVCWMREHNKTARRPVRFYGFDMQSPSVAIRDLIRTLRRIDPELSAKLEPGLGLLANDDLAASYRALPKERHDEVQKALKEAAARLASGAFATEREKAVAMLICQVAIQAENENRSVDGDVHFRDQAMAENVESLLNLEGPDGKIILWAHNGHVSRSTGGWATPMGHHLHKKYGDSQVVFGFAFGTGSFQARNSSGDNRLRDFVAPPPPPGSLDETFHRTGMPLFAVNLRDLPREGVYGKWLRAEHVTRSAGSGFSDDPEETTWFNNKTAIHESYDAIIYVDSTSAARANPDGRRESSPKAPVLPIPSNLDFSTVSPEGIPAGWYSDSWLGYTIEAQDGMATLAGARGPWEWGIGTLNQTFDAKPYRGKHLRVNAELLVESIGEWDSAYLKLAAYEGVTYSSFIEPVPVAENSAPADIKRAGEWQKKCAAITVPTEADRITLSLNLIGKGRARIRSIFMEQE